MVRLQGRALRHAGAIRRRASSAPALPQPAAIKVVADFAKSYRSASNISMPATCRPTDSRSSRTSKPATRSLRPARPTWALPRALCSPTPRLPSPRYAIAFSGDGSFMMNPQILIDAVAHGVRGMLVIFDNRRMAAITGLQHAQYGTSSARMITSLSITYSWPRRSKA